jgi:hypothetical protein
VRCWWANVTAAAVTASPFWPFLREVNRQHSGLGWWRATVLGRVWLCVLVGSWCSVVTVKGSRKISCVEGRGGALFADTERRCRLVGRYGTRRSWLTTLRGFVGAWQAWPSEANPQSYPMPSYCWLSIQLLHCMKLKM